MRSLLLIWIAFTLISFMPNVGAAPDESLQDTIPRQQDTLSIEEVRVGRNVSPEEKLRRLQEENRIIYLHGDNKKIMEGFSIFPPVIVLNINKIYNHFSTTGRQARRFQKVLIDEYEKDKIDQVWYPLTSENTDLQGQQLDDFRRYYEPDYPWIVEAEEWERLEYVFKKLKNYQDSAQYIREYLQLP